MKSLNIYFFVGHKASKGPLQLSDCFRRTAWILIFWG